QLKVGYANLQERLLQIATDVKIATCVSTIFSEICLFFSGDPLLDSPVPMAVLAIGGGIVANRIREAHQIKKYTELSVLSNPLGPSVSNEINEKIKKIIAGKNPSVQFTGKGMLIFGPLGNLEIPSNVREKTVSKIYSMQQVVIPSCVLGKHVDPLIAKITDIQTTRLTLPLSLFYILSTLTKSSKDRSLADYTVSFSSAYNLYNYYYLMQPLSEGRKKLSLYLEKGQTPKELIKLLIDGHDLQEGMSFLTSWAEGVDAIGVRIDWKGDLILNKMPIKSPILSILDLYPIEKFPLQAKEVRGDEATKEMDENFHYALWVLTVVSVASLISRIKNKIQQNQDSIE
ncbi:MAG: hypothetical protein JSS09_09330, partial [Verrucomicrobia bacterium]|nr:hypothetical protein [Verrucomicrobiota bacterium]